MPTPWFRYARPHGGKLTGMPVHPIGWALLLGLPVASLLAGALVARFAGKPAGAIVAFLLAGLGMWGLFRVMVARGERV